MRNFRSYRRAKIKFSSGINGIIGRPQSGKTNVVRALKLIASNRPPGLKFVRKRNLKQSATVEIKVDESKLPIVISKGKKTFYSVGSERFEKFGQNVPELVSNVLNLSDINFHEQLESPFLITSKASVISQAINDVTGIDNFDFWIDRVNQKIRELKAEKNVQQKILDESVAALSKFEEMQKFQKIISDLKRNRKRIGILSKRFEKLGEISARIKDLRIRKEKELDTLRLGPTIKNIKEARAQSLVLEKILETIKKTIRLRDELNKKITDYGVISRRFIRQLKKAGLCPTCFGSITEEAIERIKNEIWLAK